MYKKITELNQIQLYNVYRNNEQIQCMARTLQDLLFKNSCEKEFEKWEHYGDDYTFDYWLDHYPYFEITNQNENFISDLQDWVRSNQPKYYCDKVVDLFNRYWFLHTELAKRTLENNRICNELNELEQKISDCVCGLISKTIDMATDTSEFVAVIFEDIIRGRYGYEFFPANEILDILVDEEYNAYTDGLKPFEW